MSTSLIAFCARSLRHDPPRTSTTIESKFTALASQKSVDETGEFEGYASRLQSRRPRPRYYSARRLQAKVSPPAALQCVSGLLFQHEPGRAHRCLGRAARRCARPLCAKGRLLPDVKRRGREVLLPHARGRRRWALYRLSRADPRDTKDAKTGIRRISQIDLWEISIVTFPMMPDARICRRQKPAICHRADAEHPANLERWLMHDAGLSRSEARAFIGSMVSRVSLPSADAGGATSVDTARLIATIHAATRLMQS